MKTLLYILEEDKQPQLLTEFNEPDIPLMEGNLLVLKENGKNKGNIYEILSEVWNVDIWEKKADVVRNLFVVQSVISKDIELRKNLLKLLQGGEINESTVNG